MIIPEGFEISKRKARIELNDLFNQNFNYLADSKNQCESSITSSKYLQLIHSQSIPQGSVHEVMSFLGSLSDEEQKFKNEFSLFYKQVSKLLCSFEQPSSPDCDVYEQILNNRLLSEKKISPKRILDIGPGGSRELVNLLLTDRLKDTVYVGLEAMGVNYGLQNIVASYMTTLDSNITFRDSLEADIVNCTFPNIQDAKTNSVFQLPLWHDELLPDSYFDLIICDYILDEVSEKDFTRILKILKRTLSSDGIIFCRGSQHRAMLHDLYPYGGGTFHGQDITAKLNSNNFKVIDVGFIASQLTRFICRESCNIYQVQASDFSTYKDDVSLNNAIQEYFTDKHMNYINNNQLNYVIWGKPRYDDYLKHISSRTKDENLLGFTHPFAHRDKLGPPQNYRQILLDELPEIMPDVFIIATPGLKGILREIQEICGEEYYQISYSYNIPIAFVYKIPTFLS